MTRARCNHCQGTFVVGESRRCCLAGAVAEQDRLRERLAIVAPQRDRARADKAMGDLFGSSPFGRGR